MTDNDLAQIEADLEIALPPDYREFLGSRADELRQVTVTVDGQEVPWFEDSLYLDVGHIVGVNLAQRHRNSTTTTFFPDWWKRFLLIGGDGDGNYYCLRLGRGREVWCIGTACDRMPVAIFLSLEDFVDEELQSHRFQTSA